VGLRQILGTVDQIGDEIPEVVEDIQVWPDWRAGKALRLRTTAKAVYYQERAAEPVLEAAGAVEGVL
jgi:hypothetical protein